MSFQCILKLYSFKTSGLVHTTLRLTHTRYVYTMFENEDYFLQLVAYAEAHNKQYGTDIRSGRIFICTQNNEFQTFEIDNYDHWIGQWYAKLEQYYKSVL